MKAVDQDMLRCLATNFHSSWGKNRCQRLRYGSPSYWNRALTDVIRKIYRFCKIHEFLLLSDHLNWTYRISQPSNCRTVLSICHLLPVSKKNINKILRILSTVNHVVIVRKKHAKGRHVLKCVNHWTCWIDTIADVAGTKLALLQNWLPAIPRSSLPFVGFYDIVAVEHRTASTVCFLFFKQNPNRIWRSLTETKYVIWKPITVAGKTRYRDIGERFYI